MNETSAPGPFPTPQSDAQSGHPAPSRRRLALQVSLEAGADGRGPVQEVFPDGTYTPAVDSHFERSSAAASAFVARALAAPISNPPPTGASASAETRATESDPNGQWLATAFNHVEGAIWELGHAIGAVEALRSATPLLELKRTAPRVQSSDSQFPDGAALLMGKRRSMLKCADDLTSHAKSLNKWLEWDNAFCDSFLSLRKRCHGVRRSPDGTPLIDVGDAEFVSVRRPHNPPSSDADQDVVPSPDDTRDPSKALVRIQYPASLFLKFCVHNVGMEQMTAHAPVVQETMASIEDQSIKAVIRRIRLARVSAFRRFTFELLSKQAATLPNVTDISNTYIALDSGPNDLLCVEQTHQVEGASSIDVDLSSLPPERDPSHVQFSAMLQTVAIHGTLIHYFSQDSHGSSSSPSARSLLDRLLTVSTTCQLLKRTETILDMAARKLRVRLEWSRGLLRAEEARVRVYSSADDGDGAERLLATIEPITNLNNAGHAADNGHVRIIPAFGVIMPAPDDPSLRGRAVPSHSSSSSGGGSALGLDDVPRAYICPIGGEVMSALTLLLCIRLLDSLETMARAGVDEMLDVDRQCFTVHVTSPATGHTLKAKVWPEGNGVGNEVPGVNVWMNGQRADSFSRFGPGRVVLWKEFLEKIVSDTDVPMENGGDITMAATDVGGSGRVDVAGRAAGHTYGHGNSVGGLHAGSSAAVAGPNAHVPGQLGTGAARFLY